VRTTEEDFIVFSRARPRRTGHWAVASLTAVAIGLAGAVPASLAQATDPQPPRPRVDQAKPRADQQVTLITGDRITLGGGDPNQLAIQPGPGREQIPVDSYQAKGHLYVIPADVSDQLNNGKLDRRLFDVTGLIEAGYDDKSSTAIPLIVTYAGRAKRATTVPEAAVTRQLPVLNGTAVRVAKKDAGSFLTQFATKISAGVEKIWLDGKRRPTLDQSVPQIGAPTAWQSGYTGKGVSVAVLDGGIDATHPDLATQVAGAKNFSQAEPGDQVGHGTHVASTIAGTAAASGGKYKGVAPDAKLYDGKVCEYESCAESAILAVMEWAATEIKARVINVSLGGTDTAEIDPLEEAVNRLTAQTGTLFVIAAGNNGPSEGTVTSPGSADAALTVGAVDKSDQLADFSSRGPRVDDGAVKPDVTAPGVDIVAARAKDGYIGEPVDDHYLKLSGTSMATPHTAGAAALLAQQHPDWKAAELKAALMSSAKPIEGQNLFEQGSGRIDVAQATKQTVVGEPGNISFGMALWPHDDDIPVTKTITYRNLGTEPVTLNLSVTMTGPEGQPAPATAVKLSASSITIPAGGTSAVEVTSDTRHDGPDVRYFGRITATGGGMSVSTSLTVEKEAGERYSLTIEQIGLDGQPANGSTHLIGINSGGDEFIYHPSGMATIRLPKGEYLLDGSQVVERPGTGVLDSYKFVQPSLKLTGDTKVVMDARTTKPVKVTVPQPDATEAVAVVGFSRKTDFGVWPSLSFVKSFDQVRTVQLGSSLPADQLTGFITSQWAKPNGESFTNSPYLYGTVNTFPGSYPTGFTRQIRTGELATVEQSINATSDRVAELTVYGQKPGMGSAAGEILQYDLPAKRRLFLDPGQATWRTAMAEVEPDPGNPFPEPVTELTTVPTKYEGGRTYREQLNAAVHGPAPEQAVREQGLLSLSLPPTSDSEGHFGGTKTDTASGQLYRNGEPVGFEWPYFGRLTAGELPAEKAQYKYVTSLTRPTYSKLSTRIDYSWTFSSAATDKATPLPMLGVQYQPKVDGNNVAQRTAETVLPVEVAAQPGQQVPRIKKAELTASGDGGQTWQPASLLPVGAGRYTAKFNTPTGTTVSLQATLVDADGNITEQTVIDAYLLS